MISIKINPRILYSSKLKIGFNHTCEPSLDNLLLELKPKVMRTYFTVEDIKRSYDIGAEPFVGVRFMPPHLSISGKRESLPKNYSEWGEHVSSTLSDILQTGMKPKYYSVWNEPERIESPIFWDGTMEDYIRLYEHTVRALKRVDPDCLVGGPETTSYEENWIQKLLESSTMNGFDVDFLSFHQFENPSKIIDHANSARTQFSMEKKRIPEIHIGEWGFEVKNAYLALQHLASAEEAGVGFYCKDFFFERKWKCSVLDDNHRKRDMFYLLKEYSKLGNLRFQTKTDNESMKIIAGLEDDKVVMLLSNREKLLDTNLYQVFTTDGELFNINSLEEVSQEGLIQRDFKKKNGVGEFKLECKKAYILRGCIKKV